MYIKAALLGIIQGITEFLPISSSGHLAVAQKLLHFEPQNGLFLDLILHLGTLIALAVAFRSRIVRLFKAFCRMAGRIFSENLRGSKQTEDERMLIFLCIGLFPLGLLLLPIPNTDLRLKDIAEGFYTDGSLLMEGICFLLTGILLLWAHFAEKRNVAHAMRPTDAGLIGVFQAFATLPGLSRSGTTLSVGLLCGLSEQDALDFAFLLGIPTMIGANLLEIPSALAEIQAVSFGAAAVGLFTSAAVGLASISLLKYLLHRNRLLGFSVYCLFLGFFCLFFTVFY